jgi:hypothetical protein
MTRSRILVPLVSAFAALALAAPAGATTYCVGSPGCVAAGGTDKGSDAAALIGALASAQATAGKDRVEVGPGDYARSGGFAYTGTPGNGLDLVGAGHAQSVVTSTATGPTLSVDAPGSSVTGFGVVIAPSTGVTGLSIAGAQSVAKDIAVTGQAGTFKGIGAAVGTGATLTGSTVTGSGQQLLYGAAGSGALQDSSIATTDFSYGVVGMPDVHRVAIAAGTGILLTGSPTYKVDQVLIRVPPGGRGIETTSTSYGDALTTADHITIVGAGDPSSEGALTAATAGGPTAHNAKLVLRSSIIRGVGHALARHADHGAASIEVDHSDFDPATTLTAVQAGGSGTLADMGANVNVDPQFTSASDFHLLAGSPVIDAGAPAIQSSESATDLDGAARLTGAATDMGAFEDQPPAPPPSASGGESGSGPESSSTGSDAGTPAGNPAADVPPTPAPPAGTPPSAPLSPPVTRVKRARSCARTTKAKRGHKVRKAGRCKRRRHGKHRRAVR